MSPIIRWTSGEMHLEDQGNGDSAAPQASLCDIVGQLRAQRALSSPPVHDAARGEA